MRVSSLSSLKTSMTQSKDTHECICHSDAFNYLQNRDDATEKQLYAIKNILDDFIHDDFVYGIFLHFINKAYAENN